MTACGIVPCETYDNNERTIYRERGTDLQIDRQPDRHRAYKHVTKIN